MPAASFPDGASHSGARCLDGRVHGEQRPAVAVCVPVQQLNAQLSSQGKCNI